MSPLQRRGSAKTKHLARLTWLQARPERWPGVPGIHEDVTPTGRQRLDALRADMGALGLFGAASPATQRETLRRLLSELRGESVGVGW